MVVRPVALPTTLHLAAPPSSLKAFFSRSSHLDRREHVSSTLTNTLNFLASYPSSTHSLKTSSLKSVSPTPRLLGSTTELCLGGTQQIYHCWGQGRSRFAALLSAPIAASPAAHTAHRDGALGTPRALLTAMTPAAGRFQQMLITQMHS